MTVKVSFEEGERQMTLMALAFLALDRPGWDAALSRLADNLEGKSLFEDFKAHSDPLTGRADERR